MQKYTFSANGIENFLNDCFLEAWVRSGRETTARNACAAIVRYVNTGRAPTPFVKKLIEKTPSRIAEISLSGGSEEEILEKIKKYIGVAVVAG